MEHLWSAAGATGGNQSQVEGTAQNAVMMRATGTPPVTRTSFLPAQLPDRRLRRAQVREHGKNAAVAVLALGDAELHEHVTHMRLDRALA